MPFRLYEQNDLFFAVFGKTATQPNTGGLFVGPAGRLGTPPFPLNSSMNQQLHDDPYTPRSPNPDAHSHTIKFHPDASWSFPHFLHTSLRFYPHRLVSPDAWRVGAGEPAPEQIEEMPFAASRVERLPRDVAAAVAADLPAPPRHRPAILVSRHARRQEMRLRFV